MESHNPLSLGARADEGDLGAECVLNEADIRPRGLRETVGDWLGPAWQKLVHRPAVVEIALVRRKLERLAAIS